MELEQVKNLPLVTVDDATAFFHAVDALRSEGQPIPPIDHIFFARVDDGLVYNPYNIEAVADEFRPLNYYIVTKAHVIHVNREESTFENLGSVQDWKREALQLRKLRNIPFFARYLRAKVLLRWLTAVRQKKMAKSRAMLSKQLLMCNPTFTECIKDATKSLADMQYKVLRRDVHMEPPRLVHALCIYSDGKSGSLTPDQFLVAQARYSKELKSYFSDILVDVLSRVVRVVTEVEKRYVEMPALKEMKNIVGTVNKEIAARELHEREKGLKRIIVDYGSVSSLIRLAHGIQVGNIFRQVTSTFFELGKVTNNKEAQKASVWLFRVDCVVDRGQLSLLPSREHLLDMVRTVMSDCITSISSVPSCASSTELQKRSAPTATLSTMTVLSADSLLQEYMKSIAEKIESDYADAFSKMQMYEPFLQVYNFCNEWDAVSTNWNILLSNSERSIGVIPEQEFRQWFSKSLKLQADVKKLSGRGFGTVVVTCEVTANNSCKRLDKAIQQLEGFLSRLIKTQHNELQEELDEWLEKLTVPDGNIESYVTWFLVVQEAEHVIEDYNNNAADLQNLYHFSTEVREKLGLGEGDEPEPELTTTLRDPFAAALTTAKDYHRDHSTETKQRILHERERILVHLQEAAERLESNFGSLKANEGGSATKKLEKTHETLNRRRQESRKLDEFADVLGMDPLSWTEFGVAEDELKKYQELWRISDEAELLKENLQKTPVRDLNGNEVKDTIISLFQRSFKASKITPGDAADSLVSFLNTEKNLASLYVELCNPALKAEHWDQIFETTDVPPINEPLRTLNALRRSGLMEGHEDDITDIVSKAVGVFELEQNMAKIEAYWAKQVFGVVPYAGRAGAFVVDGADAILEDLDEQQVIIQTCLASKFLSAVQGLVEDWEQKLTLIRDVINEWISVQKSWMYLEFIFASDDIKRQLPDETLLFSSADRFFSTLMKRCADDPHVAPLCIEGDALKKLEKCTYQLDSIQKKIDEYLETKRVAFPRFYFLSNDELLSILSDSRNPLAVQPHLQKCFDNIKELIFVDPKTISSMKSSEGELVRFSNEVKIMGNVESWLNDVERAMRETLYDRLLASLKAYSHEQRETWFFDHPAQCVAATDQIIWTADVEKVITDAATNDKAWTNYMDWFQKQILSTVGLVENDLSALQRTVVSNMIVVNVHSRDICTALSACGCTSILDFEWMKQLRYYWTEPFPASAAKDCVIRHGAAQLSYGYEYLGNQPRLVITPLTERAFLTCTAALHMQKGAAPQGPAGTGKTESVKDLGKALARQVVVFNCSDGLNYKMMSQMFAGLAQGGAWACFDEFNRIELEVLSVVAQQMLDITTAIANKQISMDFEGHRIKLHPNFGVFITMNPGYAGRTELPDNLKALFRPICMMIPNYALIAEIMFYSEGYTMAGMLAKKMIRLYSLASQQLSKQDHYDFGMRAVKSILVLAGRLKRAEPNTNEELLLVKAIRDANLPKFLTDDTTLFLALVKDFFPAVEGVTAAPVNIAIGDACTAVLQKEGFQPTKGMISKCQQLFDTVTTRHGLMLVGETMNGKTTVMNALAKALTNLSLQQNEYQHLGPRYLSYFANTHLSVCNPKSISMTELYGDVNPLTREWQDGVFSFQVRELVKEASVGTASPRRHWVVFDGPVDAIWIENLNTVLDDNKMLCLVNGERIRIPEAISIVFEVQDLRVASPATVSRCGMVYVDREALDDGWTPLLRTLSEQMARTFPARWKHDRFMHLCELVLPSLITFVRVECREYIKTVNGQLARDMFYMLKGIILDIESRIAEDEKAQKEAETHTAGRRSTRRRSSMGVRAAALVLGESLFDAMFVQSCTWGIGGNLADGYRERFAKTFMAIIEKENLYFPVEQAKSQGKTMFDYCVDVEMGDWVTWAQLVPAFRYNASLSFFDLVVPTEHTVVLNYLLRTATSVKHHVLLNGLTGTAKSSTVNNFLLTSLKTEDATSEYVAFSYTLSAQTSSHSLQETLESKLTKRKGEKEIGPPIGKTLMIAVIDDCNVPQLEEYGAAPPIELLRQMASQGGFYDRKKLFFKEVVQTILMCCCGEPGGGKNELTPRFTSKMLTFCVPQLSVATMRMIYLTILQSFFEARGFAEEVTQLAGAAVDSTLEAYRRIAIECLPTPEKTHCTFNLRDVSKVIQGMLQVKPAHCSSAVGVVKLWSHEASRVFHDRLVDDADRGWWWRCCTETIHHFFGHTNGATEDGGDDDKDATTVTTANPAITVLTEAELRPVMYGHWGHATSRDYQQILPGPTTQDLVYQYLAEYNLQSPSAMSLVMFDEAVSHLSRLCRVISQPRGHALLVGVGGSGRTSLAKLAASMMNMDLQTVNIVRGYGVEDFRDDMRKALLDGGARGKEVVFQISDPQLIFSEMLEDINNVLNIGEVPGMMGLEQLEVIVRHCREPCLNAGRPDSRSSIYQFFVGQCRESVHLVLCMSPMSGQFRERLRMFPALVNCTTIDWFTEWPQQALLAVAEAVLQKSSAAASSKESAVSQTNGGTVALTAAQNEQVSSLMVHIHSTVKAASRKLYEERHRRNHTTPTSYLAALALFQSMLNELVAQIHSNMRRYQAGIQKLDDVNSTIAVLKKQISDMQPVLTEALTKAQDQKRTVMAEQKEADVLKQATAKEEAAAQHLMDEAETIRKECEAGLAEALPALEAAERALETISAKDIQEIKTFTTPPSNVEKTMNAVLILLKEKEGWASAKSCLSKMDFLSRLANYPRDDMSAALIRKLAPFVNDPEFVPEVIERTSLPCRSMCMWAHAMYKYYFVAKEIAPKREQLKSAESKVAVASADLQQKQASLAQVMERIRTLEAAAQVAQDKADALNNDLETARGRLQRADQLTTGLASERVRWEASLKTLAEQRTSVMGTAALGAGCVAYLGAFTLDYRERLLEAWKAQCDTLNLTYDAAFALEKMFPDSTVQEWALQSLPRDTYSVQNATMLHKSARWCYMIDPQGQANAFIRRKAGGSGHPLLVLKMSNENLMRSVENAVQIGQPVLLEDVGETLDAALDPILLKQVRRTGGRNVVQIGDKEVTYDDRFALYITTKLPNPVLTPELQVKVTVLNFTVTREGLEEQLLSDIVGTERAALQQSSDRCIVSIAANRQEIRALEEQVLKMLNEASGDVLDNIELINALQTSKATSDKIAKELTLVEETNAKITATREKYRPLATRGSLIYGVIAGLASVDPMYEYSLQFFKTLVVAVLRSTRRAARSGDAVGDSLTDASRHNSRRASASVTSSARLNGSDTAASSAMLAAQRGSLSVRGHEEVGAAGDDDNDGNLTDEAVAARVAMLTEEVTWSAYRVICRGLFERHKLLLSFLLATTIMRSTDALSEEDWDLFLRGSVGQTLPDVFQHDEQRPDYMNTLMWEELGALCGTASFEAVKIHFLSHAEDWARWFRDVHGEAVLQEAPDCVQALSLWHRVMLYKTVRPEKLYTLVGQLVAASLGERYTRSPAFSLHEAFEDSTKLTPIIFVLSPGTDPTALFTSFAAERGFGERKYMLSLGQDQGPRAQKMIEDGRREGVWVYLQNCHVYASWMPRLQQLVEAITPQDTHDDFRLWLTSSPSPSFPAAVLQAGMKLTREPPLGLKGKVRDTLSIALIADVWGSHQATTGDAAAAADTTATSGGTAEARQGSEGGSEVHGTVDSITATRSTARWKRLAFTLAIFTGVVMERRQYSPLGWNLPYEWGAADFAAGLSTLTTALSRYREDEPVPWGELAFMLGTIDYGGRVTDMWDSRCLEVIARQFFSEEAASAAEAGTRACHEIGYTPALSASDDYEGLLQCVERSFAEDANPGLFGLHENATLSVDRKQSAALVATLVTINAGGGGSASDSASATAANAADGPVMQLAKNLLERLPAVLPSVHAVGSMSPAEAPLHTLLSHEVDLYNRLLLGMQRSLKELVRALNGEVVMTRETEQMAMRLSYNQVPDLWHKIGYLSLKPLGTYYADFLDRIAFIDRWRREGPPPSFWLPGLFFPQGFITAVLQARARTLHVPIDSLRYRFRALSPAESQAAKTTNTSDLVGAYVHGVYLEGCGWDDTRKGLVESRPGALTVELPVLHFEPVDNDAPELYETLYECPLYKVSSRAGILSTTGVSTNFIVSLFLPSLDQVPGDHWTLRGVAGLCSLDV